MKACKHLMEMLGYKSSRRNKKMASALNLFSAHGSTVVPANPMSVMGILVQGVMI